MDVENHIAVKQDELFSFSPEQSEYSNLYQDIENVILRKILTNLHFELISSFRLMNNRLPTGEEEGHFWADSSRRLIKTIDITLDLYHALKKSPFAFEINEYYFELIQKCRDFLSLSGGSNIPTHMEKIELFSIIPIFTPKNVININPPETIISHSLSLIGSGSYAHVYKYKDTFYNKHFVLKRARKDLEIKELERFKREFEEMSKLSSPYIIEVYHFFNQKNEYVMEYMDSTLDEFVKKNNTIIRLPLRKNIVNQVLRAFEYLHCKSILHRDINPKNILIRNYEDTVVVKIADFGLVKIPESELSSINSEFKGFFNDPALVTEGFEKYNIQHETYALTRLIYYILTGKTNYDSISNQPLKQFVLKGLDTDKSKRYQNITELIEAFRKISNLLD